MTHHITITRDRGELARITARTGRPTALEDWEDYYLASVTCVTPDACNGWQECHEGHDGFDPDDEASPAYDCDEFIIHGVAHTWRGWHGWTVAYPGCVIQANANEMDMPYGIDTRRDATWLLDIDWDDTEMSWSVVRESGIELTTARPPHGRRDPVHTLPRRTDP